jgi:glycosidase
MKLRLFLILLILSILAACQKTELPTATAGPTEIVKATAVPPASIPLPDPTATPDPHIQGTNGYPWWNDAVFYEIFVRSFYDSDGDGIGDLNGIIKKLDYLNDGDPVTTDDLGVTGIWLMPIMVSPSYHGYDVVNYYQIDPDYGTNDDFKRLMEEAHTRGIHVIVDFVLNHTSTQHSWFIESKDPDSDKRDWYLWEDENPGYRGPWGQGVWHKEGDSYYYGVFWSGMPDLNYENPEVTAAMYERVQFWLEEMGVDGFRLDAIKHMVEDGRIQENSYGTHEWLEAFYTFYKGIDPRAFTVGEAWTNTQQVADYTGDEVDIAFQFDLAQDILNGADAGLAPIFIKTQQEVVDSLPANQYATFITNHDQNRVMAHLDEDEAKARLAASVLLTGTGVPFIYYGEEIGQTGTKPDEDIRRPLQWTSNSPNVGFTEGTPWRAASADFPVHSIARQTDDPDSLLSHYRALIHLRNEHEALRVGEWTLVEANSGRLYTFLRHTEKETILVIINFNRNPVMAEDYGLELAYEMFDGGVTAVSLYGNETTTAPEINAAGGFSGYIPLDEIPPQSVHIIQLLPSEN